MRTVTLWILMVVTIKLASYSASSIAQVSVIANDTVTKHSLSKRDLRSIFSMKRKYWKDGNPIAVFVLEDEHPLHVSFTKYVLKTYPYHLRSIWDRQVYSGTGSAPIAVATEEEMIEKVKSVPYSIGYIAQKAAVEVVSIINVSQ